MSIAKELQAVLQSRDEVQMRGDYGVELFAKRMQNGESALSMRCATGWELIVLIGIDGAVKVQRALFGCVAETFIALLRDEAAQAAPVTQADTATVTLQLRCPHYPSIRRAFACAIKAGLDVKADAKFRDACSAFLGRTIESRADLCGADWSVIGTAIEGRELAW